MPGDAVRRHVVDALEGERFLPEPANLTHREVAMLRMLADGATYDQMAAYFGLSKGGVSAAANRLYRKLGATCAAQAVHRAWQQGILYGRRSDR
jgi:DNA-binding CsgD family transcriptional regulator